MAHILAKNLRESILQDAILGKLTNNSEKFISVSVDDNTELSIPNTWSVKPLRDLCDSDISYGIIKLGKEDPTGVKVLRCSDVKPNYIDFSKIRTVTQELSDSYSRTLLKKNDIVITVRGTLGGVALIPDSLIGCNVAREVAVIRLKNGNYHKFFVYLLLSPYFTAFMTGNLRGIAYKGLNMGKLSDFPVPLPPLEEQTRIVARVDELMAEINEYEKIENQLVELKKNFPGDMKAAVLLAAMQGKLTKQNELERPLFFDEKANIDAYDYDLPDNWTVVKMSSVSELYTGNSIPEAIKKTKYMGLSDGTNYIGTKDIGLDHAIDYENGVKIPFGEPKFKIAKKEATLLCIEGGSAGKKMGIIKEDVCFGNKLCSFNAGNLLDSKFQYYVIQSPIFGKMFAESISGMIGGVSVNKLKDMLIPLPPIEEQKRIVEKLDKILPLCEELENEIA